MFVCKDTHVSSGSYQQARSAWDHRGTNRIALQDKALGGVVNSDDTKDEILELLTSFVDMLKLTLHSDSHTVTDCSRAIFYP